MAKSKKNKEYGSRVTNAVLTVVSSIATQKGIEAISTQPFMQDDMFKLGIPGVATAGGFVGAVVPGNEMVRAIATGVAAGAGNKLTDEGMVKLGFAGMGSAADDFLDLYTDDVDMGNIDEIQFGNVDEIKIA